MITTTELQVVAESMQHLVDRGGLPPFDRIHCDEAIREVTFLWEHERLAVVVELDGDHSVATQLDATLKAQMSVH